MAFGAGVSHRRGVRRFISRGEKHDSCEVNLCTFHCLIFFSSDVHTIVSDGRLVQDLDEILCHGQQRKLEPTAAALSAVGSFRFPSTNGASSNRARFAAVRLRKGKRWHDSQRVRTHLLGSVYLCDRLLLREVFEVTPVKCPHRLLYLGTHESFRKGWLCAECHQQIPDIKSLRDYAVVLAAIRLEEPDAPMSS